MGYLVKYLFMSYLSLFSFVELIGIRSEDSRVLKYQKKMLEELDPVRVPYKRIRPGICKFLRDGFDKSVIQDTMENIALWRPETKRSKTEKENSLLALKNIMLMSFPDYGSLVVKHRPDSYLLKIAGITIKVSYDALISYNDKDGKQHVGAIKTKLKKEGFTYEDAEISSCLLFKALQRQFPGAMVEKDMCFCFNPFSMRMIVAKNVEANYLKAMKVAIKLSGVGDVAA